MRIGEFAPLRWLRQAAASRRTHSRRIATSALVLVLIASPASAGLLVTGSNGITATGIDGVVYTGTSGFLAPGANGLLALGVNGISSPVSTGYLGAGTDAVTYQGTNGITATGIDGMAMTHADGITATGIDGLLVTTSDGTTIEADSVAMQLPNGITATGIDGITATGIDGLALLNSTDFLLARSDGITATGIDGLAVTHADGLAVTHADGTVVSVDPDGVSIAGIDSLVAIGAEALEVTGADEYHLVDLDDLPLVGSLGLQSLDPELALLLDRVTDDSSVNAVIAFHRYPTSADFTALRSVGIIGGTKFRALPMVIVTATRRQLISVSRQPSVRSIYGTRTLQLTADTSRVLTGTTRAWADADITARNGARAVSGRGVTVAVLDTGLNALHADLSGRVKKNVKLADLQSIPLLGFQYPLNIEGLPTTDLVSGHGTFVGGVIAGSGAASGGKYKGVAPGASLVGLSAGDLTLLHVLAGFDYLLDKGPGLGVRVVNCSFSANTVFDVNDPVNVATRMLADRGVCSVFSAGNTGPGWNSLNPYALAPWVVSVGATDAGGRLASFSSRGSFGSALARPRLVAPGVSVVSLRSSPLLSVTGILGIESGEDLRTLTLTELPYYTTSSGTSFTAPQVAGAIALMLEVNPQLSPVEVIDILQRTATPLAGYFQHEVGAGMLNVHAAVLEASFPDRRMGKFRAALDRGQVRFVQEPVVTSTGTTAPGQSDTFALSIPQDTVRASLEVAWGPLLSLNDLGLSVFGPNGSPFGQSNTLNLPGLTGKRERVDFNVPAAGTWLARVAHTLPVGTSQAYTTAFQVSRVAYAPMTDVDGLTPDERAAVNVAVRMFVMTPEGNRFRPGHPVARRALAEAMVLAGRAPQYLAGAPRFPDVRDAGRLYVESVQAAPGGPYFPDASPGAAFNPFASADRLTAAIVLVRAAGLGAEAAARAGASLPLTDASAIPSQWRGYVAVALERGLLAAHGGAFEPGLAVTRLELAQAIQILTSLPIRP
jgi:serine protease AprX